jgi:hypothetical protein
VFLFQFHAHGKRGHGAKAIKLFANRPLDANRNLHFLKLAMLAARQRAVAIVIIKRVRLMREYGINGRNDQITTLVKRTVDIQFDNLLEGKYPLSIHWS